jgi:hypothetical protein
MTPAVCPVAWPAMGAQESTNKTTYVTISISILALLISTASIGWQCFSWFNGVARLSVEQIYDDEYVISVIVRNSGRDSATVGGFHLRSNTGDARIVLSEETTTGVPEAVPRTAVVRTYNSNLSPGGLEYFTLSVDAIAQEIMFRNVDMDSMEMFLTTGVGDLSFELSNSALNRIAVRVGQLKG